MEAAIDACAAIEIGAIEVALARDGSEPAALDLERFDDDGRFYEALVGLAGAPPLLDAYRRLALPGDSRPEADEDRRHLIVALAAGDAVGARRAILRRATRLKTDVEGN
jgi:DNA-binding GntR family transcriptional regulator